MAAVSYSIKRGKDGFKISDFTIGTLAPNADDFEVRLNLTDANGAVTTRKEMVIALMAVIRGLESGALISNKPPL